MEDLLEHSCILCKLPLKKDEYYFCTSCVSLFSADDLCFRCGLPTLADHQLCEQCMYEPPVWKELNCICDYHFPVDILIQKFKYQDQTWLLKPLIDLLRPKVHIKAECLIPIPMHWKRQLVRGYNQSNLLAAELGKQLGVVVDYSLVKRRKVTHTQQGLTAKERENNLYNAFVLSRPNLYKHVAIIDDVVTTGTTIKTVADLLLKNGVKKVDVICLSRTKY